MPPSAEIFRGAIRDMHPYSPPPEGRTEGDDLLLDFNERTTESHLLVRQAVEKYAVEGRFQVYHEYGDLDSVIADYIGVGSAEVIPTNGSDQAIDIVTRALVRDGDVVIIPAPTFAMLEQSAHVQGAKIISPRYFGPNLEFPHSAVMGEIKPGIKLVVICNPNNPTGTPVPREQTEAIIKKVADVGAAVLVDEAYHEFTPELTVVDLVGRYKNLFITRSFSKTMGIASLRAGCVISQEQNILELRKIRGPYDVSMPAVVAMKALRHPEVVADINAYVSEVMNVSKPMLEDFYRRNGIIFFQSSAGFHLLQEPPGFIAFLKERKILVRRRSDPPGTVRVSIGTQGDTRTYMEAFSDFLKSRTT